MKKLFTLEKSLILFSACLVIIFFQSCNAAQKQDIAKQNAPALAPVADSTSDLWDKLDIVPMPRQISLTGKNLLLDDKTVIVLGQSHSAQAVVGADWINKYICDAGGRPLTVNKSDSIPKDKISIIIGTPTDNSIITNALKTGIINVGDKNPGERGYEIKISNDGNQIYLAGADNIGTLYACVTFAELIRKKDNSIVWREALVRDWPDVIKISLGADFVGTTAMPELMSKFTSIIKNGNPSEKAKNEYLNAIKQYYDWLLKRKVTLLNYYAFFPSGKTFEPNSATPIVREGIEYGKTRGIGALIYAETPFAGLIEKYPEIAANTKCPSTPGPHSSYNQWIRCWSQDAICLETALNFSKFINAMGITDVGFHDTDTGYYDNPAQWRDRCDKCKKRWGDDYTAATINKFKIYYDEIKRLNPDATLHITLYPYDLGILMQKSAEKALEERYGKSQMIIELATQYREKYTDRWKRLHAAFPLADITFCIRETNQEPLEVYREITQGRGTFVWLALMSHAWKSFFSEAACWTPTFCDNTRDVLFVNYIDTLLPLESLAVREYSWNKNTPGARPFDKWEIPLSEQWKHSEAKGKIYSVVLPKLVRNVFGCEAAPYIIRAVSENIDMVQIFGLVHSSYDWLTDYKKMQWQADNAETAVSALDELWAQCIKTNSKMGMDDFAFLRFIYLRESLHMSMWMAKARAQNLLARELAMKQDIKEAEKALTKGNEYIRIALADKEKLKTEQPALPLLKEKSLNKWAGQWKRFMSSAADFSLAEKSLKQSASELKGLGSLGTVPANVIDAISKIRSAKIKTINEKISIDGKDSEAVWKEAYPIETFLVLNKGTNLARACTRVKLLSDKENIYIAVTAYTSGEGNSISDNDSIEIFLTNTNMASDYIHFFLKADGTLKQQYNKSEGTDGMYSWKTDNSWTCIGIESAISKDKKNWTAELKIPFAAIQTNNQNKWKINVARACPLGAEIEYSSILPPSSTDFHDLKNFTTLTWANTPCPAPIIKTDAQVFKAETRTLKDAIASVVDIKLEINSNIVLNNVKVTIEGYGQDGILQCVKTIDIDKIFYKWIDASVRSLEYQQVYKSGGILVKVKTDEGISERWFRFGNWQGNDKLGNIFSDGFNETKGLSGECNFQSALAFDNKTMDVFNSAAGTIEFWVKPAWQGYSETPITKSVFSGSQNTFIHYGPNRKDNPRILNNSPLSIFFTGYNNSIMCTLYNSLFAGWSISASVCSDKTWFPGNWHHIAFTWDAAENEKNILRLYIDGKRLPANISLANPSRLPKKITEILVSKDPFPIQVGSLNTGWEQSNSVIDELRISRIPRYMNNFTPEKKEFTIDKETSVLFHFNGNLLGEGLNEGGKYYIIEATSGISN